MNLDQLRSLDPTQVATSLPPPSTIRGHQDSGLNGHFAEIFHSAVVSLRNAEQISVSSMTGQASVQDVAEALMDAERQIQFSMTVRDKITSAFLELTHMAI